MTHATAGPRTDLLTLRQVADVLGVSTGFVRGEIRDGRLRARVEVQRPGGRTLRRVALADFAAYCRRWCPRLSTHFNS